MPIEERKYLGQAAAEKLIENLQARLVDIESNRPNFDASNGEPGYIDNRPFYKEEAVFTFDGDLTDREYFTDGSGISAIKMTSDIFTTNDLIGQKVVVHYSIEGTDIELVIATENIVEDADLDEVYVVYNEMPVIMVVPRDFVIETNDDGTEITVTAGTYFVAEEEVFYTKSLSYTTYHKIPAEYLPEISSVAHFDITVTANDDGSYTADKTPTEIAEAYNAGKIIRCIKDSFIYNLIICEAENDQVVAGFEYATSPTSIEKIIYVNDNIEVLTKKHEHGRLTIKLPNGRQTSYDGLHDTSIAITSCKNPYALTINDTSYDGSAEVAVTGLATESYVDSAVSGVRELIGDTPVAEQISNAVESKFNVQIITWEADD